MSLRTIDRLDDCYRPEKKTHLITGLQSLVRLMLLQSVRDREAGLDTGGFVSGYRGSPLGGLDRELWRAGPFLEKAGIHFEPGLNEELAATSIWGTQQSSLFPETRVDGVFSLWYGKGPGVDRSGDAIRHGNSAGTSRYGGVLLAAGDDHMCKSSTLAQQSEHSFIAAMMPVLNPASVEELIELGLLGFGLSRFSGCWVGMKTIPETADATQTTGFDHERLEIVEPTFDMPPGGLGIRSPDPPLEQEHRLHNYKLRAAEAFARANGLDRIVIDSARPRLGLVTSGKSHADTIQALSDLGLDPRRAADVGIRLYKVGMSWPLEPEGVREFAEDLDEILVIEEKRAVIEPQIKEQLAGRRTPAMPLIVGKMDEHGRWLLPSAGELTAGSIAKVLAERIARFHTNPEMSSRVSLIDAKEAAVGALGADRARLPHFCSGCPHNTSTRVPDDSFAIAGIGCHFMALWMGRNTQTYTQMGAEGASWIGQAPFTDTEHVFQNIGDGTYVHSGSLAIRAAVASGVNITYKILHNDAVAMTGGQPVEGGFSVGQVAQQLLAEGVRPIVIVTDHPEKFAGRGDVPDGVKVRDRREFDRVQRELKEQPGASALIYDQTCAAELRRRRKSGTVETPARRVVINELVCEGCGDCNRISNCLSVVPVETEFGRKRAINQSACNRDFTCLEGFCPSFVTLHGAEPRAKTLLDSSNPPSLPEPPSPDLGSPYNILVAGIGGTGIVTASGLISLAAHLEGKAVMELDQTGLAQKFGAVLSHVRIANRADELPGPRIPTAKADLLLGGDLLVAAGKESLLTLAADRSAVLVNTHEEMPPNFVSERDLEFPSQTLLSALRDASKPDHLFTLDASRFATAIVGDSLAANTFLLGAAVQLGLLPVSLGAIERALELFGRNVEQNKHALLWGRVAAVYPDRLEQIAGGVEPVEIISETLDDVIRRRIEFLTDYQDSAYAERYRHAVEKLRIVESRIATGRSDLAEAVARNYFKLLAYKDEYEVARLYTDVGFVQRLRSAYDGRFKLRFHFSPPIFARPDPVSGRPRKYAFGGWVLPLLHVLKRARFLRGTVFDPFGYGHDRRTERELIAEYEALLAALAEILDAAHLDAAIELASLPDQIRGFGPVKNASVKAARVRREALLGSWSELGAALGAS